MLMLSELHTAVQHRAPAVWVVLNDGAYGMVDEGMRALGWQPFETHLSPVDFAAVARGMGAASVRVEREQDLEGALRQALEAEGPFLVDVVTMRAPAPSPRRQAGLLFARSS
jgi:acetolactate synthase-1/2/3 large subunit